MRLPDVHRVISVLFFYTMYIGGKYILFQLFLAILLNDFDERSITEAAEKEAQNKEENTIFKSLIERIKLAFGHKTCA